MAKIKRSQRVNVLGPFRGKRPTEAWSRRSGAQIFRAALTTLRIDFDFIRNFLPLTQV